MIRYEILEVFYHHHPLPQVRLLNNALRPVVYAFKQGAPLSEVELAPVDGLGDEIRSWILRDSTKQSTSVTESPQPQPHLQPIKEKESKASATEEDLYDF